MKKIILITLILNLLSCMPSDYGDICDSEKIISFYVVDSLNKKSLINDLNGPFTTDSYVTDENGNLVTQQSNNGLKGGLFKLLLADQNKDSTGTLIRKKYFIYLVDSLTQNYDIDTLLMNYNIIRQKCGGVDIKTINCIFNDSLYKFSHFPTTGSEARFIKKGY